MQVQSKLNGRATSVPRGLALGTGLAVAWSALCIMLISLLVSKEIIGFGSIGYGIVFVLITSSYLSAKISYLKIKQKRIQISVIAAGIYFLILMIVNILFYGGEYTAVGVTLACVICGAVVSLLGNTTSKGLHQKRR